ncbi:MAG: GNAT family N-acetyltransferase [Betaproteobacteria bacterium]
MSMAPGLRSEGTADAAAIRALHLAAFPTPVEADLVEALREAGAASISEVAVVAGAIVGHVMLSPMSIGGVLGLAPIAVAPGAQKQGIGAMLMRRALQRAREMGAGAVVLLGEPAYYRRFGFAPARIFGLRCKWPGTGEAFMALELRPGFLKGRDGLVSYHPAFDRFE